MNNKITPKVSIIVPIYNVEKYLNRCMDSLIHQSLKDIEIILVDDGSPDNCPTMCDEYSKQDSRIKVVHKKNGGLGFARNTGLEIATGEFIAFVDSDDYVNIRMYESLYRKAVEENLDAVFCGYLYENRKHKFISKHEVAEEIFKTGTEVYHMGLDMIASAPKEKSERKLDMSVWRAIYSRKIIQNESIRFYSERVIVSEDMPFNVQFLKSAQRVKIIPECYYHYCYNDSSLSNSFNFSKVNRSVDLYKLLKGILGNNDESNLRINRFLIGYLRYFSVEIIKSNINFREKYKLIELINNNEIWNQLKKYKISYLPFYSGIALFLQKRKLNLILIFYFKLFAIASSICKKN